MATLLLALHGCAKPPAADETTANSDRAPTVATHSPQADTLRSATCAHETPSLDDGRVRERLDAERVARSDPLRPPQRDGGTLVLTLENDHRLVFIDCASDDESARQYWYEGLDQTGQGHVVRVYYYEASEVLWVHAASGHVESLASVPVFAPDGLHFAIANADLEAGYTDNVFAIYRVTAQGAEQVFRDASDGEWGASSPVWHSAASVSYTRLDRTEVPGETPSRDVRVTNEAGRWRVTDGGTSSPPR